MDAAGPFDETCDRRLYVGNLDHRITEAALIKMFSPYGKIESEDFLWHTRGPKRGEPRGYAFIQFSTKEEAQLAKEKMFGRLVCGRPLVVRFSSERNTVEPAAGTPLLNPSKVVCEAKKSSLPDTHFGQTSRSAKIAAIKNKLKSMEADNISLKRPRQGGNIT